MSRANPSEGLRNPSTCWFEWKSKQKCFSYYDKDAKTNVPVKLPFTFIVLDRTATVRGYNPKVGAGLYSNEIRDTRRTPLVVKYFKDRGAVATGLWADIKDRVEACKGKFALNIYIAYRVQGGGLAIGCIQATGCAMGDWFEFEKKNRKAIDEKAVVASTRHDTSGSVAFDAPVYQIKDITPETNAEANKLAGELASYFAIYLKQPVVSAVSSESSQKDADDSQSQESPPEEDIPMDDGRMDEDVPF